MLCNQKKNGKIVGYMIVCDDEIHNDSILFIETLCQNIFFSYQILLLNSKLIFNTRIDFIESLTDKEFEILKLICEGKKDQEISEKLFISFSTVRTYIENIFLKGNVNNRTLLCCLYYNYIINQIIN